MSKYFSATTCSFYDTDIISEASMPADKVIVSQSDYEALMTAQASGDVIYADQSGNPAHRSQGCGQCTSITHELLKASNSILGHVKIDQITIVADENGVIRTNIYPTAQDVFDEQGADPIELMDNLTFIRGTSKTIQSQSGYVIEVGTPTQRGRLQSFNDEASLVNIYGGVTAKIGVHKNTAGVAQPFISGSTLDLGSIAPASPTDATTKSYVDAVDKRAVHKTGDEVIEGVKTFNAPPYVPTPIRDTQAAPAGYVNIQNAFNNTSEIAGYKTLSTAGSSFEISKPLVLDGIPVGQIAFNQTVENNSFQSQIFDATTSTFKTTQIGLSIDDNGNWNPSLAIGVFSQQGELISSKVFGFRDGDVKLQEVDSGGNVTTKNMALVEDTVLLIGDQTIEGVKTFSASPIVPDPTMNTQAANKVYVDRGLSSKADSNTTIEGYGITDAYTKNDIDGVNTTAEVTIQMNTDSNILASLMDELPLSFWASYFDALSEWQENPSLTKNWSSNSPYSDTAPTAPIVDFAVINASGTASYHVFAVTTDVPIYLLNTATVAYAFKDLTLLNNLVIAPNATDWSHAFEGASLFNQVVDLRSCVTAPDAFKSTAMNAENISATLDTLPTVTPSSTTRITFTYSPGAAELTQQSPSVAAAITKGWTVEL